MLMNFDVEGKATIIDPKVGQIKRAIKALKSYGPSSYASLTDEGGRYVQVAGGGITCMVERFDPQMGERLRAFHDKPNPVYPDGTILSFRAGNIPMKSDEWFKSDQVAEIFVSFLRGSEFPAYVSWRRAPEL
ncbi:hypothetical protein MAFF211271_46290 (plasmid) [Ralstonia syzygii subsp. indonesiensis]|nr:hypothetical protein MAFF211271_46290 [Ralstonia pseudosolanacearum]